jgi:feruloyl-CoA synthase
VPFRETDFLPVDLAVERRADGAIVLRSRIPLREFEPCLPRVLAVQAARLGDKPISCSAADRSVPGLLIPTPNEARHGCHRPVAPQPQDRSRPADPPALGNSIAHALVKFGGMAVGVPACPVSPNYGLMDSNFARLRHVVQLTRPGVVFVEQAKPFARALEQVDFGDALVLTATPEDAPRGAESLDDALATPLTSAVAERIAALARRRTTLPTC